MFMMANIDLLTYLGQFICKPVWSTEKLFIEKNLEKLLHSVYWRKRFAKCSNIFDQLLILKNSG